MSAVLPLLVPLVIVVTGVLAVGIARRQRDRLAPPGQGLTTGADGVTVVPIVAAEFRGGLMGVRTRNSLGPKLALTPQGVAFKVLKEDHWPYDQLTQVDVAKGLFGPMLDLRIARGHLTVTVRDLATARQVLAALPPTTPFTRRAAALRADGTL